MLRSLRLGLVVGASVLLAGCQSFFGALTVDDNLEAARLAGPPSGAFNAALQQEYIAVAETELAEYDFEHADTFARKALAAGNDEAVAPEDPADWRLTEDQATRFVAGRQDLLAALDDNGRSTAPGDAAQAQAMYDCWLQEEEILNEGHQPADIAACRDGFEGALARVQEAIAEPEPEPEAPPPAPEPPARDYLVYFDFDSREVGPDAASLLDRVVAAAEALGASSIALTGHTDTSGAAAYNQALSLDRALAVAGYLRDKGITVEINTVGKGETDPRVETSDGVQEQENRRVEIRIN